METNITAPIQSAPIKTPPTLTGLHALAWEIELVVEIPDQAAAIGQWLIVSPRYHPFWSRWVVSAIHLRDIEGAKPAYKHFAGATHEINIVALNPEYYHEHENLPPKHWRYLTPVDVVEQFAVADDDQARVLLNLCIRAIVDGRASPDSDFRSGWTALIQGTAKHFREGRHAFA